MPNHRSNFSPDHDACGVGLIAAVGKAASHDVVERSLSALSRLAHRGGVDADGRSGDGAGLLTLVPDRLLRKCAAERGLTLPHRFAVGMVFLAVGEEAASTTVVEKTCPVFGINCIGWRTVPVDASFLGARSRETLPLIRQCFFSADSSADDNDFELRLFRLRTRLRALIPDTYFCSLSSRIIVYKGLLTPQQLPLFYKDLADRDYESTFAIFHQRYSTNTQPSWKLAQPFRMLAHNGEINTISANRRWFQARTAELACELNMKGERILEPAISDSGSLDNALESLWHGEGHIGRALSKLVPPAWENDDRMNSTLRAFFQSSAQRQEAWDGPGAFVFGDGELVGAKLDRNGLRPLRYVLTEDGLLVVGSEVGITDLHGRKVVLRQRLGPGDMLIADLKRGELLRPSDITRFLIGASAESSAGEEQTKPNKIKQERIKPNSKSADTNRTMAAMGWSEDQYRMLFEPLVMRNKDALWSMGDDTPPAFLSGLRRPLWDYCKQRFAQVTNPPIDPLREAHVMSMEVRLDAKNYLLSPVLDSAQLQAVSDRCAPVLRVDITVPSGARVTGARSALRRLKAYGAWAAALKPGAIVITDIDVSATRAALPVLLAVSSFWESLVANGGWRIPLLVETGQIIDTHHVAMVIACGASAVHPWLGMQLAAKLKPEGAQTYANTLAAGLRKVLARMGISTVASYRNSQLFEVIGLDEEVVEGFFPDATHALGGKCLDDILEDYLHFHSAGFGCSTAEFRDLGLYRFRHYGERHSNSPELVRRMHRYLKFPNAENQKNLALLSQTRDPVAIRDLLEIRKSAPLGLNEVESEASLLSRFSTQAMSLGAISPESHETISVAMNRIGSRSNTGEGGEDRAIYAQRPEANNRVKQVASGRFGVTTEYLIHADELEIKIAQGAKPGEGGQLPSSKVTPYIARLRHTIPGTSLISPPPHHDIYSIEDLTQLVYDLRAVNPNARIGVKLVASCGVGIIAAGVAKAGADVITISGHDGGTGASPLTSIKNTGIPWEIGLRETHSVLLRSGLRAQVRLRVDGGLKFARDVVIAALLGADEFGFGTAALLAIGCVMARQCHLNTCPVGIATQDEGLRARFTRNPDMVERYFRTLAADVREMLAAIGARSIEEIVGRVDKLQSRDGRSERSVSAILQLDLDVPEQHPSVRESPTGLHLQLNRTIDELESLSPRTHRFRIFNSDRAVGAHFSGEVLRRHGVTALELNPIGCEFTGIAGQSFGAFLINGASFRLHGEANDYVGKSLSGGTISISAGAEASARGDVLVGNTALYGATSGELYVGGRAGERFAVRNSGALAVVEGAGQHACEYMTAGIVVALGPVGVNFGAGMTGGLSYVAEHQAHASINNESVRVVGLDAIEQIWLRRVLRRHAQLTGSPVAMQFLASDTLALLRVEPIQRQYSLEEGWSLSLSRMDRAELQHFADNEDAAAQGPLLM
jgi:glutamate synthase (ferredoxin)